MTSYEVRREHNSNEYTREGRNGRLYTGVIGLRWFIYIHGELAGEPMGYKTRNEAVVEACRLCRKDSTH